VQQQQIDAPSEKRYSIGPFPGRWLPAPGVETERRLIAAARRFDRTAFDRLISAHRNRLCAFLVERVGREAMDDILQETLLAAWQALPTLQERSRFSTWLFGIAVHKAADYHSLQGRRTAREVSVDIHLLEAVVGSERESSRLEHREMARYLLDHLTVTQRQLLELYYFEGLTLLEIATALNRNLNAVKYHFYSAHTRAARYREALGEESIRLFTRKNGLTTA